MKFVYRWLVCLSLSLPLLAHSQEATNPNFAYFGFEPDIITTYISTGKTLKAKIKPNFFLPRSPNKN